MDNSWKLRIPLDVSGNVPQAVHLRESVGTDPPSPGHLVPVPNRLGTAAVLPLVRPAPREYNGTKHK